MIMRKIIAYNVDEKGKYFVGVQKGIKEGKCYLKEACMVKGISLFKGEKLEEVLKKRYIKSSSLTDLSFDSDRIIKPYTFYL